ncbi:protein FLX-like 2 isoform X2 [Dioscorea cayenensis subsp. rotundata]|uniref:Protein FLX-like 2 isoform X2 n=1 Tax=Dioscorea cayennensis subsp. rotundata TaxID=55577 RepID=A0AB40AYI0_DIOCR|nr:protein FLX-like 2 isoform X2 [Dioscorea cayenensis subsp. rotundata]
MGSKGRVPPHLRRPLPGPGMLHPDPFSAAVRPPPGAFPLEMLPLPEVLEQKLAAQHIEMERLATENQRIAATHSTLRQELAAAQQELQRLQSHMGVIKAEQEQQMRALLEKNGRMEAELQASEPFKADLQQAHAEVQNLVAARQELILKIQQLNQDLQRSHGDAQQIPALLSELDALRQEYEHCRATYEYERKIFTDHYESLQLMEKNYISMVREVEKLRAELANAANTAANTAANPGRSGGTFGSNASHKEIDASNHHSVGQTTYEDGYGVSQMRGSSSAAVPYGVGPLGPPPPAWVGHDARGPGFDASRNAIYDTSRGAGGFDTSGGTSSYDPSMIGGYGIPRGANAFEAQRGGSGYDAPKGPASAPTTGPIGNSGHPYGAPLAMNPYGSAPQPPPHMGSAYDVPRAGNVGRR